MTMTINKEQRLYVTKNLNHYTCQGFDNAHKDAVNLRNWLVSNGVEVCEIPARIGTKKHYAAYKAIMKAAAGYASESNSRCLANLSNQLIGLEGKRVEVVDCYGEKRRFQVGRSTGWYPIHLEIANKRSSGGGSVTGLPFHSVKVVG
ncbi:hypothetical protein [Pectobacterium phage Wc4-1]|uniref:Uncharacterized protein n=1 Tax=Pectobacterium phage Wc4 TaxID=2652428 RepID=A0A5P8D3Z0_9CAUD|nr:hypothetical protein [Pectobacterium phage Wc4]QFP93922.1 hypothetical protein [Pectobacterium phage Wc4-1]